jgi:hypothetical protein
MQAAPGDDLRHAERADDGPQRSVVTGRTHSSSDAAFEFAGSDDVYRARAAERTPRILGDNRACLIVAHCNCRPGHVQSTRVAEPGTSTLKK